jgi:dipeptidyl aminopeptidase/acylaminoacyl peptidase
MPCSRTRLRHGSTVGRVFGLNRHHWCTSRARGSLSTRRRPHPGVPYADMIDGMQWAIEQKYGDPARVCVVGASFGGYLALSAPMRDSARLRCVVSVAGVSDLQKLETEAMRFTGSALVREFLGTDASKLKQASPRPHADTVGVPVLLIHGDEDSTVDPEQTVMMDTALTQAGKAHRVVMIRRADHYFSEDAFLGTLLSETANFLRENLGAT